MTTSFAILACGFYGISCIPSNLEVAPALPEFFCRDDRQRQRMPFGKNGPQSGRRRVEILNGFQPSSEVKDSPIALARTLWEGSLDCLAGYWWNTCITC